jgi:hypothetical protein
MHNAKKQVRRNIRNPIHLWSMKMGQGKDEAEEVYFLERNEGPQDNSAASQNFACAKLRRLLNTA